MHGHTHGRLRQLCACRHGSSGVQELIVVTILLAAKGSLKVPSIQSQAELREALNKLGAVRSEQVRLLLLSARALPAVVCFRAAAFCEA